MRGTDVTARVVTGDCLAVLPTLDEASVDAVVTDPPYHLTQASRGGSPRQNDPSTPFGRTRLGFAGFMGKTWDGGDVAMRPETWAECLRVAKPGSYLVAFGGTRTYHRMTCAIEDAGWQVQDCLSWLYGSGFPKHRSKLKPAWEPAVLAWKWAARATPLNIDACRIGTAPAGWGGNPSSGYSGGLDSREAGGRPIRGRWPANAALDADAAVLVDAQSDGASSFFYTAKAARREREAGLEHMPARLTGSLAGGGEGAVDPVSLRFTKTARNVHPTVKPLDLMQWLCRLVTPKGGLILDPFCGSGTTGRAAIAEGFRFLGIELSPEYADIARARIADYAPLFSDGAA